MRVMYCEMLFIIISINLVKLHLCSTVVSHTVNERSVLRRMVMELLYSNYTLVLLGTVGEKQSMQQSAAKMSELY